MSLFLDENVCTCVACGCDDAHACPGGCSWVAQNLESMQGLCSACERDGLAVLIQVRLIRNEFVANSWYRNKAYRTGCVASARSAVSTTARKMFGPGSRVVEMCEQFSVVVAPRTAGIRGQKTEDRKRIHA